MWLDYFGSNGVWSTCTWRALHVGDARSPAMQSVMNLKISFENLFGHSLLRFFREYAQENFEVPSGYSSLTCCWLPRYCRIAPLRGDNASNWIAKMNEVRSSLQTHACRITRHAYQTVDREAILIFYDFFRLFMS